MTSVRIADEADWIRFKAFCKKHGLTTCHIINMVVKSLPMADQAGVHFEVKNGKLDISSVTGTNPLVFNFDVREFFGARPRGHGKYDLAGAAGAVELPKVLCNFYGGVAPGRVYCRYRGLFAWLPWEKCRECERNRYRE